jgi:hypothetical protein
MLGVQLVADAAAPVARAAAPSVVAEAPAAPGSVLWVKRYNGRVNGSDSATSLGVSPDGSTVFVTGDSVGPTGRGNAFATVAYTATTGSQLWVKRYNPLSREGSTHILAISSDGSKVFVTGGNTLVAYDASTGAQLWVTAYFSPKGWGFALAVSPDASKVFVTGSTIDSSGSLFATTIAYDATTGARLWVANVDGATGLALGASPDGSTVFMTGTVDYPPGSTVSAAYVTVAYDASTGTQLWTTLYLGADPTVPTNNFAVDLVVSHDGAAVFVAGSSSGTTGFDFATVAYNAATGAQLWVKRYDGPAGADDLIAGGGLGVSPDGSRVYVTGTTGTYTSNADYATVAYNASSGAKLWVKRYNGPANGGDFSSGLVLSPDGSKVFVTGESSDSTFMDYGTVAYDASTGAGLWVKRYKGPKTDDRAHAIGVKPDGTTVFVTGSSPGSTPDGDFVTIAYSTT